MYVSLVSRFAQGVKAHVPLIKFRKGQLSVNSTAKPTVSKGNLGSMYYELSEAELPSRFKRQPLDEQQINAINSGGCV